MKNITITVEEQVARWARVWAARHNSSVSKLVGELLKDKMEREQGYQSAMKRDLARGPIALKSEGMTYPTRDALHER